AEAERLLTVAHYWHAAALVDWRRRAFSRINAYRGPLARSRQLGCAHHGYGKTNVVVIVAWRKIGDDAGDLSLQSSADAHRAIHRTADRTHCLEQKFQLRRGQRVAVLAHFRTEWRNQLDITGTVVDGNRASGCSVDFRVRVEDHRLHGRIGIHVK